MGKTRIYIKATDIASTLTIDDEDVIHKLRNVLRLKKDKLIYIFDGCGKEYVYSIQESTKNSILLIKEKLAVNSSIPENKITLAFPLEKEERVDFILQKATELGVWNFIPFTCKRSIPVKPSAHKINRWCRIVIEAARQSQRLWIPEIQHTKNLKDIFSLNFDLKLVGSFNGKALSKNLVKGIKDVLIVIGPVGDFSDSEYNQFKTKGFKSIKLSQNLLRTETAAVFFVGMLNHYLNES